MALPSQHPILYLITSGETTRRTEPHSPESSELLALIRAATHAGIDLIQLREKNLTTRTLYELALRAASITRGSRTRLLINDRADVALAAGCDGVHLTTRSAPARIVREAFGPDFLIGVSTHSLEEARCAHLDGADFAVFGPVFDTPSKRRYGEPLGLQSLKEAARNSQGCPLIAIGGITRDNAGEVLRAGARGVAAIRLFNDRDNLEAVVREIKGT